MYFSVCICFSKDLTERYGMDTGSRSTIVSGEERGIFVVM
jgi:hypothetical protein